MKEMVKIGMLLEIYGKLLTDKQEKLLNYYYNNDLSLAEIAEFEGITRQAVRDNIKKGEKKLFDYEEKLGVMKKTNHQKEMLDDVISKISDLKLNEEEQIQKELQEITDTLKKII